MEDIALHRVYLIINNNPQRLFLQNVIYIILFDK